MKQRLFVSTTIGLLMVLAFLIVQNEQLKEQLISAEIEKEQYMAKQEMKEMRQFFSTQPINSDIAINYHSWIQSKNISKQLYKDSEGLFQEEWGIFLGEIAQQKDIDPYIVYELLKTETGGTFNPELVGPHTRYGQAYGMAQFMENTAPWIADMAGLDYDQKLLFDPLYSIQLSIEYLSFLYEKYEDWDYALTAYHRGMYGLEAYIEEHGNAQSWYAVEIQENAEQFNYLVVR
ncbi:transglycosylase SLT domain-containing protein [Alkalihalobacillus trypoxylicola]|uniref:Lytic transglycosylase n=1 Tax=Alkalihalobacillus trypoxylicola TaxID=519424 RepID=A0A162E8T5_9BACI|nr:transglycosylase SLT domain-containing protein [Alkalihalobacillus trypoxylicola]KYG32061.1 lytic transglycosylase [Alkalihalobacillus trypoxylicola]GAF65930.1 lytic transglycosylase [Bacillus sp. TS-2]